jgi:hypothetical protein
MEVKSEIMEMGIVECVAATLSFSSLGHVLTRCGRHYWLLVVYKFLIFGLASLGIITAWVNFGNADAQADKRLTNLESKTQSISGIEIQLSQIQTDLAWIKLTLSAKAKCTYCEGPTLTAVKIIKNLEFHSSSPDRH